MPEWLIGGSVGAFISGLLFAISRFLDGHTKRSLAEQAASTDILRGVCDRQEKQIALLLVHMEDQQRTIARQHQMYADCRGQVVGMHSCMCVFHGIMSRLNASVVKLGGAPEEIPEMPDLPPCHADHMDYLARASAEGTIVARDIASSHGGTNAADTAS